MLATIESSPCLERGSGALAIGHSQCEGDTRAMDAFSTRLHASEMLLDTGGISMNGIVAWNNRDSDGLKNVDVKANGV